MPSKRILTLLSIVCFLGTANAQQLTAKTIFELFKIPEQNCPFNAPDASTVTVEGVRDEIWRDQKPVSSSDILPYAAAIGKYLRALPENKSTEQIVLQFPQNKKEALLKRTGTLYKFYDTSGKLVWSKTFFHVEAPLFNEQGFNAWDTGANAMYFDNNGKLLFNRRFQFVRATGDCFNFYKNSLAGIVDKTGKILVPAKYHSVTPFIFNKEVYFHTSFSFQHALLRSDGTPLPIQSSSSVPLILGDRYWLVNGKLYDMIAGEQLFCNLKMYIDVMDRQKMIFSTAFGYRNRVLFDIKGNLISGYAIESWSRINSQYNLVTVKSNRDTLYNGQRIPLPTSGIANVNHQWLIAPGAYYHLNTIDNDSTHVLFCTDDMNQPGMMTVNGKVIIPENKFRTINKVDATRYICMNENSSSIFDIATGTYTALPKPFVRGRLLQRQPVKYFVLTTLKQNETMVVDSAFQQVNTPALSSIYLNNDLGLYIGTQDGLDNREHILLDKQFRLQPVVIGDLKFERFKEIRSVQPGMMLYWLTDGRHILQYKDGRHFETTYNSLTYDPAARWFMGYKNGKEGIVDTMGRELLPPLLQHRSQYSSETGMIQLPIGNDRYQYLTKEGKLLFDGNYDYVSSLMNGYYIVGKNGNKGIVHRSGKILLDISYQYVDYDRGEILFGNNYRDAEHWPITKLMK